jgi:hypothetical protein
MNNLHCRNLGLHFPPKRGKKVPTPVRLDLRAGEKGKKAPTHVSGPLVTQSRGCSPRRKTQNMPGCQPERPRAGANPHDGKNLQAVECHPDQTSTNVPPPTFDRHELRQMIFQLVGLASVPCIRTACRPYSSGLPRFLGYLALPTRPGSAVPTFSHELLRWICRRALDTEIGPMGLPLARFEGTRFQSSPLLLGSVITLSD